MQLSIKKEDERIYSWKPIYFSYLWNKIIIDNKEYDIWNNHKVYKNYKLLYENWKRKD